jgi:hypothetical protein
MEEKIRIEEETRKVLYRYGGDVVKTATELGLSYDYVFKVRQGIEKDMMKNPEANLRVASNIFRMILRGMRQRDRHRQDMLDRLENREQLLVCPKCETEVYEIIQSHITKHHCPNCDVDIKPVIADKDFIYKRKQSILRDQQSDEDSLIDNLKKMGFTGAISLPPEPPPSQTLNQNNNFLILGGAKEQKVIEEIKHLPPLEAEKLRRDLKKEIFRLDDEIRAVEAEEKESQ